MPLNSPPVPPGNNAATDPATGWPILHPGVTGSFVGTAYYPPAGYQADPTSAPVVYDPIGIVVASQSGPQNGWAINFDGTGLFTVTPPAGAIIEDGYSAFFPPGAGVGPGHPFTFGFFDLRYPYVPAPVMSGFGLLVNNQPEISLSGY